MLDYRTLTFLTVCQEMNFTRAAKKLHISQPAVSQHMQYLEEYYGVKLFRFVGKSILLTDAGKLLKRSLTALHNNELYLKEQLAFLTDKKRTLHFGATLTVGEFMIARPLADFLKLHKDADVSVTVANTAQLLQQLDEGSIDFAILEGNYSRAAYSHIPFLTDQFVPICSSSHPFANTRHALSLTDLTGETLLIREPGSGTRSILEQALNSHDLAPSDFANLITIGNMNAIKEMTAAGAGITFLYETAVKSELKNGTIQKIPITSFDIRHEISIVWKKDNLFQEFFLDVFRELQFRT